VGELLVVRHGETGWSRDLRHTGLTDVPLTESGRRDAKAVGALLAGRDIALALCSPLSRARDTAQLALGEVPPLDDRLVEWDYGEVEGRTTADYRLSHPGWTLWRDGCPGGETVAEVGSRADSVLAEVVPVLEEGDVLLVAHGHLLRIVVARRLGLAPEGGALFALQPATLGIVGSEHGAPALRGWNLAPAS
jgi:probable phosphoglycerate mutase